MLYHNHNFDKIKIAVIIPNYNNASFIKQCILSLENQTAIPDEIIIVDDCSTDNSIEIIREIQTQFDNIKLIKNSSNRGVSFSRNVGALSCSCDYICFLDSDDYIDNIDFFKIIKKYQSKRRMCFLQYRLCDVDGNYIHISRFSKPLKKKYISKIKMKTIVCQFLSNKLVPRNYVVLKKYFKEVGMFNETMNLYEDSDLVCRLMKKVRPFVIDEYGPVYRIKNTGLSHAAPERHNVVLTNLKKEYYGFGCHFYLFYLRVVDKVKRVLSKK